MRVQGIVEIRSRAAGGIPFIGTSLCLWLLLVYHGLAAPQPVQYETIKGKVRIEGTSNIDDWQVEGKALGGYFKVASGFPQALAERIVGGEVLPQAELFVEVGSLKSIEKDGKPFSNLMDEIMHAKLKVAENPRIQYQLSGLVLTAKPRSQEEPYRFEAKGDLAVAGVTNHINLPINLMPLDGNRLRIWGSTALRMTDFKIDPPAPKIALGIVKTGDEVKISFEWVVTSSGRPHSAAAAETLPR